MFEDYKERVVLIYDRRKKKGLLSPELMHPSPANLKAECVRACDERFKKNDEPLLRSFIGQKADAAAYRAAFQTDTADKFRPLSAYLRERKTRPDERNIELLSLLLNLNPRPYKPEISLPPIEEDADDGRPAKRPAPGPADGPNRRVWIIALILLAIGIAGYSLWPKPEIAAQPRVAGVVKGKCMSWAGDRYLTWACSARHSDTPVVALDTNKMAYFRKISDWNTLGENSVRKAWYAKINGKLEIYTAEGFHPVDTIRRLLPLSRYMYKKYIHPNDQLSPAGRGGAFPTLPPGSAR
jgi:hypothetical protein